MAPPPNTYPYGYAKDGAGVAGMGTMLTMEQYVLKQTVYKLHPELWRRFSALMKYALTQGVYLGVGTGWRIQPAVVKPGFAPPGNSNHEGFPADGVTGGAVAIDTVCNVSWPWMEKHLAAYGLKSFININNEPWHVQPREIPNSRSWRTQPWTLVPFNLPGGSVPPTTPPPTTPPPTGTVPWHTKLIASMPILVKGNQGTPVKRMQHFLALAGKMSPTNMANFDGIFGNGTLSALNAYKLSVGLGQDGRCSVDVWSRFMASGDGIPSLAKGAQGTDVKRMQRMLSANGYMDPANQGNFDGIFGSGTESAVKKFQTAKGLSVDGKCGPQTWTALLKS
jgi:peptidoglycan hydrolase-like protein with peptidoglycan-binding domain